MPMRRKIVEFTPVVMIAEQDRTPADLAAIQHMHTLHGIVMDTMDTERSRKTTIGISEIGGDCRKCVARKLSGLYPKRNEGGAGWRAQVGTMGHDYLEHHFIRRFPWMFEQYEVELADGTTEWKWRTRDDVEPTPEQPIYYLERKLKVWEYKGLVIEGSCDLFTKLLDASGNTLGIVSDWKFQGPRKLADTGKGKIGSTYHVQMSTYGLGYELDGLTPTHLDLHALPRDGDLNESRPVLMRYDRQIAIDALTRLAGLIDGGEQFGWLEFIEMLPTAPGCFDCDHFNSVDDTRFITDLTA